jgi:hypothetical protein
MKNPAILILSLVLFAFAGTAVGADPKPIGLEAAQKKKLDTFFSNFSEAAVPSFAPATLTDEILISFGIEHWYINNFKQLNRDANGVDVQVTREQVDQSAIRYFGRPVKAHAKPAYRHPLASGEAYTFSQIDSLAELGNDTFLAEGTIYTTGSGDTIDPHGTPAEWKRKQEAPDKSGSFVATIKADGERYVLVDYTVTPTP